MTSTKINTFKILSGRRAKKMCTTLFLLFSFMIFSIGQAAEVPINKIIKLDPIVSTDEIPVEIFIKGYGKIESDVLITDRNRVYIDVNDFLNKLGILCVRTDDKFTGFIENENRQYTIDFKEKQITIDENLIRSPNGFTKESGTIFVESTVLNEAFGFNMLFNYRSLSIVMDADFELPLVKKARLEKIRQNVSSLQSQNEIKSDTIIGRNYHLINGLAVDWAVNLSQIAGQKSFNNYALGLGTELLYGDVKVGFAYYDKVKFDRRQLYYNWRWVDNDSKFIKQAQAGKIPVQSISFLGAPLVGATFTNSPNTIRKAKGSYIIRDYTEPNWTVELYLNDVLVNYTTSDASGLYVFEVPIIYGYTTLKLKFYGLLGEERVEERTMNTPYTFMPKNVMEYNVTGGVLEDDRGSQFSRGEVNYGITRSLTVGGGVEYLSSLVDNPAIPFANVSFQPFTKMVLKMKYANGVSYGGLLNYYFGQSTFLEVDYINYVEGQKATLNITNEELKVQLTLPFKGSKISGSTQFNFMQYGYDTFNFNQFNAVFSGHYKNYSSNVSLSSNWITDKDPYISTIFVFSHRLRNGLTIRPSLQYNVSDSNMIRFRADLEKRLAKMYFSASYERNVQFSTDNLFFNFKYDLPYARTNISATYANNNINFAQGVQGSLAFGGDNGYINKGNNSALGKGGILLYPFLDLNQNGKRDDGEKIVLLSKVKVSGAKAIISAKDSIVRISDLNAFVKYNIGFSDAELENISWRFRNHRYQVLVDPNQYKKVEVPIVVMGELGGTVFLNTANQSKGLGRISIQIFNSGGKKVAEVLSESDGYFNYLGLKPGKYTVLADARQLENLEYQSSPLSHEVTIEVSEDGTVLEGLNFHITAKDSSEKAALATAKIAIKAPIVNLLNNKTAEPFAHIIDAEKVFYTIKVGVYKDHNLPKKLENLDTVFYEDLSSSSVQYFYGIFDSKERAVIAKNVLTFRGILGTSIVKYQNGKIVDQSASIDEKANKDEKDVITKLAKISSKKNTSFERIFDNKEDFFSVQIGAFKNYVPSSRLEVFRPIYYELTEDDLIRYTSGKFKTFNEAKKMKFKITTKGIKDAFIVKYKEGVRYSLPRN
ncbi:carboxypeptidase-like regulatory domain-containing protein [Flavobacterium sp. PL12]|uniref:carboxypeptidase-like regulatory domain-containing protein n=1 Tax=Flavobacterium sp. PL12 TaxID=3071718 RepID=UPI00319E0C43